jgi:hypothetical protein
MVNWEIINENLEQLRKERRNPKKYFACVCGLVNLHQIMSGTFDSRKLIGEIHFKHWEKCPVKDSGKFETIWFRK